MQISEAFFLFGAAFVAGVLNAVFGGGTFVSFPALIWVGIPPLLANTTNAVAVWPACVGSALGYRGAVAIKRDRMVPLGWVSALGGGVGAFLLLITPESSFLGIVPGLLFFASLVLTFGKTLSDRFRIPARPHSMIVLGTIQFGIAVYGGYFGGGMGLLMMATFAWFGFDNIHEMNALRSILAAIINGVALLAFSAAGAIVWLPAIVMAIGASFGGYLGARAVQKVDPRWVKRLVLALAWAMTAHFWAKAMGIY